MFVIFFARQRQNANPPLTTLLPRAPPRRAKPAPPPSVGERERAQRRKDRGVLRPSPSPPGTRTRPPPLRAKSRRKFTPPLRENSRRRRDCAAARRIIDTARDLEMYRMTPKPIPRIKSFRAVSFWGRPVWVAYTRGCRQNLGFSLSRNFAIS